MADIDDGFDSYYAERLWQLLPAVYRTADTDGTAGLFRERAIRHEIVTKFLERVLDYSPCWRGMNGIAWWGRWRPCAQS